MPRLDRALAGLPAIFDVPLCVVCAWCGCTIEAGRQPVSHGICQPCSRAIADGDEAEAWRLGATVARVLLG